MKVHYRKQILPERDVNYKYTDFKICVGVRGRALKSAGGASGGGLKSTSVGCRSSKIHPYPRGAGASGDGSGSVSSVGKATKPLKTRHFQR